MRHRFLSLLTGIALFQLQASSQCGINILTNPGFESPAQPGIGNNLTGSFTFNGWTSTVGPFNVIRTDGSAYGGGPDNAQDGVQYVDVTSSAGTVYQDFTLATGTVLAFGGYFSSRESGSYTDWTASVEIYALPGNTLVATSSTRNFTAADGTPGTTQEVWHYLYGTVNLPAGNYRYVANLGDYGNFDAPFVFTACNLPVTLRSFTGNFQNGRSSLNWKVEQASAFSHFEIERSTDGRNFTTAGRVNFSGANEYRFSDDVNSLSANAFHYRLKLVDANGSFRYSSTVLLQRRSGRGLLAMPNPVKDYLTLAGLNAKGQIKIVNAVGQVLWRQDVFSQSLSADLSFLNKGIYFLQYFNGTEIETRKLIKE